MLNEKQFKCLGLMLQGNMTEVQIAKACDINRKTIHRWKTENTEFQLEYNKMMQSQMQYISAKAYRKMIELLDSNNAYIAFAAAKDLLDRSGFKPDDNIKLSVEPVMIVNDLTE